MTISKKILFLMLIAFFSFNNCNTILANEKTIQSNKITSNHVEPYKYKRTFILRFSNIIYDEEKPIIVIPIFQGKYENVLYSDLLNYCVTNNLLEPQVMETGFMIKTKKGEVRKTFHDFLAFYKSNIFKDINVEKPTVMSLGSTDWIIKYDFTINNIPCYMKIELTPRKEDLKKKQSDLKYKSVYDIIPMEEEKEPGFLYDFYIGSKSTD